MKSSIKALKQFVHRFPLLEFPVFFLWGILTILRAKAVFKHITQLPPSKDYTVIINSVRSFPVPGLIYFEALFAHAFKKCGVKVKMLFHDDMLWSTDAKTTIRSEWAQNTTSRLLGNWLKRTLRIEYGSYWDYISQSEIEKIKAIAHSMQPEKIEAYVYKGISVGLHAKASATRYFLSGIIDLKNPYQVSILRKKLIDAMISAEVAQNVVVREKPNTLFTLHGVYSTWGPFLDYFHLHGIDTVIYGIMTSQLGYFMFLRNIKVSELPARQDWEAYASSPLTEREEEAVNTFYKSRMSGEGDEQKMYQENYDTKMDKQKLLTSLGKGVYEYRYVMYPNLAWDFAIAGRVSHIFPTMFAWIEEVIDFFKAQPRYQLIIKPHPAQLVWEQGTIGIQAYIERTKSPLPENIILLPPNVPLTAYDVLTKNSIGIVFNGTLGMELAVLGLPALVASQKIHYSQAGITYRVKTKSEYFQLLKNPTPLIAFARAHQKWAKKYAYFLYYICTIRIPCYRNDQWSALDWKAMRNKDLLLGSNSNFIKICRKIIRGKDIVNY